MATTSEGVSVAVAASALGVSVNAIRKRINRKSIEAYKDTFTGEWRVIISDEATPPDLPRPTPHGEWSQATPTTDTATPATPAAAIIREAIAPFVTDLKAAHERIGTLEAELRHERERHRVTLATLAMQRPMPEGTHEPLPHAGEQIPIATETDAHRAAQPPRRGIRSWLRWLFVETEDESPVRARWR